MTTSQIDINAIERLKKIGGDKLMNQIIEIYLNDTPAKVDIAMQAVEANDLDKIADIVHSLKSSSGNVGAMNLSQLANKIEVDIRTGNRQNVLADVKELKKIYDSVIIELKEFQSRKSQ